MALPVKFDGSVDRCHSFLWQCNNFFAHQPDVYHDEATKCAFLLSLLTRRALDWASTVWDLQVKTSFTYFTGLIQDFFKYPAGERDISVHLLELRQGSKAAELQHRVAGMMCCFWPCLERDSMQPCRWTHMPPFLSTSPLPSTSITCYPRIAVAHVRTSDSNQGTRVGVPRRRRWSQSS